MKNIPNIPNVAHFYWGGDVLPYLRYITILSFARCNPSWKLILYRPTSITKNKSWHDPWNKTSIVGGIEDYFPRLSDINNLSIVPFDMEATGHSNGLSEVIKSDIIRLYLLSTVGGIWSDMDIVYFNNIETMFTGIDCDAVDTNNINAMFCNHGYHSIGFIGGAPSNVHFTNLYNKVASHLDERRYESIGSEYYNKLIDMKSSDIFNIPMASVYPQNYVYADSMFIEPYRAKLKYITPCTIGWHWYAGNPICGEFQNKYTENNYKEFDNIISHLIGKVYDRI